VDVWCIGDINYFVSVLNGLAMLSNSGLFSDLIKLGLIIAVLVIGFQAIFQAGAAGGELLPKNETVIMRGLDSRRDLHAAVSVYGRRDHPDHC